MRSRLCRSLLSSSRLLTHRNLRVFPRGVRWSSNSLATRQWSTPLAKNLAEAIETTGPISIASYMRQCLTSPDGGYYTSQKVGKDQFGQKGDFITSPEISQIFGELIGLWFVTEWMKQAKPSAGVEIIEVGPGRGTLMDDMLRTLKNFKGLAASVEAVYLVEASPALRESQKRLLCGDEPLKEVGDGYVGVSKHLGVPITWYEDIRFVPNDPAKTPFIVAHEFFDALPIHAFQSIPPNSQDKTSSQTLETPTGSLPLAKEQNQASSSNQWRELVVTPTPSPEASTETPSTTSVISPLDDNPEPRTAAAAIQSPDFQLSISKASTSNSLVLPTLSQRYKDLLSTSNTVIEISPEAQAYAADFAHRIGGTSKSSSSSSASSPTDPPSASGAALILDYGPPLATNNNNQIPPPFSTLRGIHQHTHVSPLSIPGKVDISADVDFTALADAACHASEGVEVHGPIEQGVWLEGMGVWERVDGLVGSNTSSKSSDKGLKEDDKKKKERIRAGVERLVERERKNSGELEVEGELGGGNKEKEKERDREGGMGRIYKVLAIVPERGGGRPVGFGGDVGSST